MREEMKEGKIKTRKKGEKMPQKIDLNNGITIDYKNGRDGKAVELNIDGTKKKLSQDETGRLIDSLMCAKHWFSERT